MNNRAGSIGVRRLRELVNERDRAILQSVRDHRFLSARQISRLHFWNHRTELSGVRACNRVLNRLRQHRFIFRLDERTTGGAGGGSMSHVWGLDVAGDRLLRADDLYESPRVRPQVPSLMFLNHTLSIADVRVELETLARIGQIELLEVSTEPDTWRHFNSASGPRILKPDLFVETAEAEWADSKWLEIDLGTESLPVILKQCRIYMDYRATGKEEALRGVFPAVVWLMDSERRAAKLRAAIGNSKHLDSALFSVITRPQLSELLREETVPEVTSFEADTAL